MDTKPLPPAWVSLSLNATRDTRPLSLKLQPFPFISIPNQSSTIKLSPEGIKCPNRFTSVCWHTHTHTHTQSITSSERLSDKTHARTHTELQQPTQVKGRDDRGDHTVAARFLCPVRLLQPLKPLSKHANITRERKRRCCLCVCDCETLLVQQGHPSYPKEG